MDSLVENFFLGTIFLPLLAALFKSEISSIYKAWMIFRARPFDADRDPNTPDRCQVYNSVTGKWGDVLIERYVFSLDSNKRGVFVRHPVGDNHWAAERIPLLLWADMRKRRMPATLEKEPLVIKESDVPEA